MTIATRTCSLLFVAWLAGCALAQDTAAAPKKLRVHVLGASVSGGFKDGPLFGAKEPGDSVALQVVLKAWCGDHARASTHNVDQMAMLFQDPVTLGGQQIDGAKKGKPDAVVAIDFPFWFAYGEWDGKDEAAGRKAKLAKGLELLAQLDMPVLVGDLPDMRGAAARMLRASWIPPAPLLAELNQDLAAFVGKHPNFRQVKLAAMVQSMKVDGITLPLASGALSTKPGAALQGDRLHANRLGVAFLAFTLQPSLRELFAKEHPLNAQQWTFEQFVEACGAGPDVEDAQAAAKKVPAAGGVKGG
jgi:hypothetical protein